MTGRQRTFELVPTTLVKQNASRPPMTSKAAKKAYLQAQRGPRISKAEQRKRDAEEYERIRKEHEKEKNAARAQVARDKKAAKVSAEKEARRKLGLPEPSRFVRASQPTISKFVRGNSCTKRSWKEMNGAMEETEDPVSDSEREESLERDKAPPFANQIVIEHESEDEFGEFPLLSPSALDKIESSATSLREDLSALPSPGKDQRNEVPLNRPRPSQEIRTKRRDEESEDEKNIGVVARDYLPEAAEVTSKGYASEPLAFLPPPPVLRPQMLPENELFARPLDDGRRENKIIGSVTISVATPNVGPVLQERSNSMPPPRLTMKKPSISFSSPLVRPERSHQNNPSVFSRPIPRMPPSATQAFLEDHLDDFLPSPSQQVRELLDDIDDVPTNAQITKEIGPQKAIFDDNSEYFICTQDFVLTPQDLEEIITPSRAQPDATSAAIFVGTNPPPFRALSEDKPRFFEEKEEDLFYNSRPPRSRRSRRQVSIVEQIKPESQHFFEGEEQEMSPMAVEDSKKMARIEVQDVPVKQSPKKTLKRALSAATDYGDDEFIDCSQELLALC